MKNDENAILPEVRYSGIPLVDVPREFEFLYDHDLTKMSVRTPSKRVHADSPMLGGSRARRRRESTGFTARPPDILDNVTHSFEKQLKFIIELPVTSLLSRLLYIRLCQLLYVS